MNKTIGQATLWWGTGSFTMGMIENLNIEIAPQKELVEHGSGETVGAVYFNFDRPVTLSFTPIAGAEVLAEDDIIGATLEIPGLATGEKIKVYVDKVQIQRRKKASAVLNLTCTYHPSIVDAGSGV